MELAVLSRRKLRFLYVGIDTEKGKEFDSHDSRDFVDEHLTHPGDG
jgi:hypothetical protein